MDINRVIFDFCKLLTGRTSYLTEDSVRYYLFSCMLNQDPELNHYIMELPYNMMTQFTNGSVKVSTETLKSSDGIIRQELDLLYDGVNDIVCIEIKFHRHADVLQVKKKSAYAHTDAAGRIINDMRRLSIISSGVERKIRRLFVYLTDDEMNDYLSNNKGSKENEQYRKELASFYFSGGTFDCEKDKPNTFIKSANTSFKANQGPLAISAMKLLFITAIGIKCPSFQNGNSYISLFEINGTAPNQSLV